MREDQIQIKGCCSEVKIDVGGILLRFRLDIQHFWPKMQKVLAWLCHVCILIAVKGDSGGSIKHVKEMRL